MTEHGGELEAVLADPWLAVADERPDIRRLAAALLGRRAPEERAGESLRGLLADDSPVVRAAAAEALGSWGDPGPLLAAAGDTSEDVREAIAFALGEIGDAAAVPWLSDAAASDPDDATREAAVGALGAIEDASAVSLLVGLAASAPPKVRRRAVVALSAFDTPEARRAIERAATDRNPMVKEVAEMVVGPAPEELPWPTMRDGGE